MAALKGNAQCKVSDFEEDKEDSCPDLVDCGCQPSSSPNNDDTTPDSGGGDSNVESCPPDGTKTITEHVPSRERGSTVTSTVPCDSDPCASKHPVLYGSGAAVIKGSNFAPRGYGRQLRNIEVYNNLYAGSSGGTYTGKVGNGWSLQNQPRMVSQDSGNTVLVYQGTEVTKFAKVGGVFKPQPYRDMELSHDVTGKKFVLKNTKNGSATRFNDFNGSHATAVAGQPIGVTAPSGTGWDYAMDANGNITGDSLCPSVVSTGDGGGTASGGCAPNTNTPQTSYGYTPVGGNNLLGYYAINLADPNTGDTSIRRTEYVYYSSDVSGKGSTGDLKLKHTKVCTAGCTSGSPTWTTLKTSCYRYYTASSGIGFKNGLKFILNAEAYQRAAVALGAPPEDATDAQLEPYADYYFEYDSSQRVSKERRFGAGAGSVSSTYTYTVRGGAEQTSYNEWQTKTVETKVESGKVITVFTNFMGQVLLRDVQSGSSHWYEYYEYDTDGRVILTGKPSGITGYSQSGSGALSVTKNASTGLFLVRAYYGTSDTAPGHLKYAGVKKGYSGTLVKEEELEWIKESDDEGTVYAISKKIRYLTETDQTNSANQAVTTFAYEFHNNQITKKTTTLPAVATAQNGANVTNTIVEDYNQYGYLTKFTDARGVMTVYEWNIQQGQLINVLKNYINASTYVPVNYEYDSLGRVTKKTKKIGTTEHVRWFVYDDLNFERREADGYITTSLTRRFNPATIFKFDRANRLVEVRKATNGITVEVTGALTSATSFPQNGFQAEWVRWQTIGYDNHSLMTYRRDYFSIPSSGTGTSGTNYNQTDFGYSATRDLNRIKSPGSTIRRMVYDSRGKTTEIWVGTNDTGATDSNPGAGSSNLVKVRALEWDGGSAGGDGNLTKHTNLTSASDTRVTDHTYNWRDRRETTTADMGSAADIFLKFNYDNLSRVTLRERRVTNGAGALVTKQESKFDKRGHLYQRITYPASGAQTLTANYWYDETGNRIKVALPGSDSFNKTLYDNLNRVLKEFTAYGTDSTFAQVKNVSNNVVMRQADYGYDDVDNLLQVMVRERYHDESTSDLGELQTPTSSTHKARVTCRALYYDDMERLTEDVNYGTNGTPGTWSWTRPSSPPADTAVELQTRYKYNVRGERYLTTVVDGVAPSSSYKAYSFEYDDAGRLIQYVDFISGGSNLITQYEYTADSLVKKLIANNSTTGNQTTEWIYGVTTANGSEFYSNELVYQKKLPDSTSSADRVTYGYNRQGQSITVTDQNGSVHAIGYDKLGRILADSVGTLGSGVDGSVRLITAGYNEFGLNKISSYASTGGGTPVNEVEHIYNEWGQVTDERQSHSGATSGSSPKVVYAYENGSVNNIRLKKVTHPTNTNAVDFVYGVGSSQDDKLSRVKQLKWNGTVVTEYSHLGLDRSVIVDYQEPDVKWNLVSGSGNYPYTGWDQFDRVIQALWQYYGGSPADREKVVYGFDRASNRLWRQNAVAGTGQDEYYTYDGVFRLKTLDRGTLNGGKTGITGTPSWEEDWSYDDTGNWRGSSTGYLTKVSGSTTLNQNRTHNVANEITDITETVGGAWTTPAYDGNGNGTQVPRPLALTSGFDLKYDAWNRLVEVKNTGGSVVATYRYDGTHRRVTSLVGANTRHHYFSLSWQILEERVNSASTAERSFVWGLRYLDDLVLRQKSSERLYALHDYYGVTAIVNTSGTVLERYGYDGFGTPRFMNASFATTTNTAYSWETLYAAYRYDTDTGLYQVRFRYLHPKLGRWINRDPIGEHAGVNQYAYVVNNPANKVDPLGLEDNKEPDVSTGSDAFKDLAKALGKGWPPYGVCLLDDFFNTQMGGQVDKLKFNLEDFKDDAIDWLKFWEDDPSQHWEEGDGKRPGVRLDLPQEDRPNRFGFRGISPDIDPGNVDFNDRNWVGSGLESTKWGAEIKFGPNNTSGRSHVPDINIRPYYQNRNDQSGQQNIGFEMTISFPL